MWDEAYNDLYCADGHTRGAVASSSSTDHSAPVAALPAIRTDSHSAVSVSPPDGLLQRDISAEAAGKVDAQPTRRKRRRSQYSLLDEAYAEGGVARRSRVELLADAREARRVQLERRRIDATQAAAADSVVEATDTSVRA
jgi:hypothetical protein